MMMTMMLTRRLVVILGMGMFEYDSEDDVGVDTATAEAYFLHQSGSRPNFF